MFLELPKTVAANIRNFTGRTWLLPAMLNWLEQADDRLFILNGATGTGISMIIAWLLSSLLKERLGNIIAIPNHQHAVYDLARGFDLKECARWDRM